MNYEVHSATPVLGQKIRFKIVWFAPLIALLVAGFGCDSAQKSAATTKASAHIDAAKADDSTPDEEKVETGPNAVVAKSGAVRVTLEDFDYSYHMSRLVSPLDAVEIPKEELASPKLQAMVVQNLLREKIIRYQAEKYEIESSPEERIQALKSRPDLARFSPLLAADSFPASKSDTPEAYTAAKAELTQRGLSLADLEFAADNIVFEHKLRDVLLEKITDEDVWRDYRLNNDRARVLQVHTSNTPTMDELLAFLKSHPREIEQYFAKNKRRWERKDRKVELDDSMRRHIAAILVAENSPLPSVQKRMDRAIKQMEQLPPAGTSKASEKRRHQAIDKLIKEFEAQGLVASRTELFPHTERGFIPEIGIAKRLSKAIFETELSTPISPRPILSRDKVWAFMLLEREHPSREAFERDKAQVRAAFVERAKEVILDQFVMKLMEVNQATLDLKPIQAKYGKKEDSKKAHFQTSAEAGNTDGK